MDIISSVPFSVVSGSELQDRRPKRDGDKFRMPKAENGDDFEFERRFAWLMHDVQRLIRRNWARTFKASGSDLSEPQARILANLERQDGGLTQTQLANELEMEKAPLGRLLDRMEESGYVTRQQDPEDRRARRVVISDLGMGALPDMRDAARTVFAVALKDVSDKKIDTMLDVLASIKTNLSSLDLDETDVDRKQRSKAAE